MSKSLLARLNNAPVLVAADQGEWLAGCVRAAQTESAKIEDRMSAEPAVMQDDFWPAEGSWLRAYRPYNVLGDGTLIIPIKGYMAHDFSYQIYDWVTGYTYIQKAFERGMADPFVKRIAMVVNSGGGDVAGNFDLVDRLYAMRGEKPIHAFVNEHSYSAAFSITTVAERIYLPRTGGVGSVGVLTAHVDVSKMLDEIGYKITLIHSGEHKVDGNPYEGLKPEVKARIQKRIDSMRQLFAETVARNLGMAVEAVLATEAQTYSADEAIEMGFAHEIRPIDEALAAFSSDQETTEEEEDTMSKQTENGQAADQAGLDAARAEGRNEGALAERTRIQGILNSEAAKERGSLANHIAMNTDMSVEAAVSMLEASPKATAAAAPAQPAADAQAGADFKAAMANGNPNMTAEQDGQPSNEQAVDSMKEFRDATGYGSDK